MQEKIKEELKQAMKDHNAKRLNVIRMLKSALTNELVALGRTPTDNLSDEEVIKVLKREAKKRKDSITQYSEAGRKELADNEKQELNILEEFLPEQMSREEIEKKIREKLATESIDPTKRGQFIGLVMRELGDRADGTIVKEVIEDLVK